VGVAVRTFEEHMLRFHPNSTVARLSREVQRQRAALDAIREIREIQEEIRRRALAGEKNSKGASDGRE
jgi:predicted nuclease with RNAse H fold